MEKVYLNNIKILIILSYVLTTLALIILEVNSPVAHYELSIYSSIPLFWILIIVSTLIGIVTIIYQVLHENYQNFWFIFFILILNNFIILNLPYFRGYYLYGGNDPNAHLKKTILILLNGHFSDNYYPVTHIFGAQLIEITSIRPETAIKVIPPIFSILFMLFIYYLADVISSKRTFALLTAAAATPFLFTYYHVTVYPHAIGIFLYPIIFYLYFKSSNKISLGYTIVLIILLALLPYVHAVPAAVLISCLFVAEFAKILCKKIGLLEHVKISFALAVFSAILFITWWSSFAVFGASVEKLHKWLFGEVREITRVEEVKPVFELGTREIIELLIKMYGAQLIYYSLSLIAVVLVCLYLWKKKSNVKNYFIISILFITTTVIYMLIFLTQGFITVGRFLGANTGIWATPVLVAFFFGNILFKNNNKKTLAILVALIIIISFTLSVFSVYRSPWILQPNWHFTYCDISADMWKSRHPIETQGHAWMGYPLGNIPKGSWKWTAKIGNVLIPSHFGYDNNTTLRQSLPVDTYILFGEYRQRVASENPHLTNSPVMGTWAYPRFNQDDLNRFKLDQTVNIVYSNGDVEIILVRWTE